MKILSIGKTIHYNGLDITSIEASSLPEHHDIELYQYIIINGGDGTIRRVLKQLHNLDHIPVFILNPTGSFNVVAKIHRVPKIEKVLDALANGEIPNTQNTISLNSMMNCSFFQQEIWVIFSISSSQKHYVLECSNMAYSNISLRSFSSSLPM